MDEWRVTGAAILGALVIVLASTGALRASALSERGRHLAETHCARCHVVSEQTRMGGISSTPSFMILIKALEDWRNRFATFFDRPPHPAHIRFEGDAERPEDLPATIAEVILSHADVDALLAYADQLAADTKD
ncbi:hypothetical protein [Breoghania sp. L-A4]|uniref:hypothetical protein n=1 Tax=Breoghania sp. L-A4 TaxID=2304600 RepID=UPI000E35F13C|nr:hypothetical protein [Breoghania sp. L-A4]AXS40161.1 hypothetical protein D1F64_08910 [Breoghania sp. L-A4]